jgi:hypothetical protein
MRMLILGAAFAVAAFSADEASAQLRGDTTAVAAANRLLEQAGGEAAWSRRTMDVEERGYLRNGDVADMRIVRDFESGSRLNERRTATSHFMEFVSPDGGWVERDGVRGAMSAESLAAILYGLAQEPYAIYHRLAKGGDGMRVELREEGALLAVFDRDERYLCWFRLAPNGALRGWGNFYDGRINEHFYGPIADMGDANLPRWGAASDGGFRFEYVRVRMTNDALEEPHPKRAGE